MENKIPQDFETLLTSREIKVLYEAAKDYSNKEIANILSVSESTVRSHRENIYKKLGIKGKKEVRALIRKLATKLGY